MSDFITKLERSVAQNPNMEVQIDIRVNTEVESVESIKKRIHGEYGEIVSMSVITHGKPTQGMPELVGDGKIVVIRAVQRASDHLEYLKRKEA